ncbi:MAG: hypothetical protein ACOC6G_03530 [Thermoproteota archaeon]
MGMDRTYILEVEGLTKIFDNRVRAVDGISFKVKKGEILGLLGPNGAARSLEEHRPRRFKVYY